MEDPLSAVLPTLALAFRSLTAIFTPLIPPETLRIIPFLKTQKRTGLPCENPNSPNLLSTYTYLVLRSTNKGVETRIFPTTTFVNRL